VFFLKDLPTQNMVDTYAVSIPELSPDKAQSALKMLRSASILMRKIERYFASNGVSQTQFLILIILHRDPEKTLYLASEIAQKLDISKPVLSKALKTLMAQKLVREVAKSQDARTKPLQISSKGEALLLQLLPEYFTILQGDAAS